VDWNGTSEDPSGYFKLREFVGHAADELSRAGHDAAADRLRDADRFVGLPSEWMGEFAWALKDALAVDGLSPELRNDLNDALAAIRLGFERVGTHPTF
jgi:hypothetical protein